MVALLSGRVDDCPLVVALNYSRKQPPAFLWRARSHLDLWEVAVWK